MSTGTKALLIAAGSILLLFFVGDLLHMRSGRKEPRYTVMELDTALVSFIRWEDASDPSNNIEYSRSENGGKAPNSTWTRTAIRDRSRTPSQQASGLMAQFQYLKVKREMGMIRLLADRYDLTESTLQRITFLQANGKEISLNLGSTTFAPGKVGVWTYVNIPGEKEVYAVEGALADEIRNGVPFDRGH